MGIYGQIWLYSVSNDRIFHHKYIGDNIFYNNINIT